MTARVVHGSREHFQQVVDAHVIGPSGNFCRCGANAANGYRAHIADVWRPYELPEDFLRPGVPPLVDPDGARSTD